MMLAHSIANRSRITATLIAKYVASRVVVVRSFLRSLHSPNKLFSSAVDDVSEYEPFWAAAATLDLPLSLHTATRRQGRIRGGKRRFSSALHVAIHSGRHQGAGRLV
jgi:hypothetical protein